MQQRERSNQLTVLFHLRHADDFSNRGLLCNHLVPAGFAQGLHAVLAPQLAELHGGGALQDRFFDVVPDEHDFVQRHPALVAGTQAPVGVPSILQGTMFTRSLLRMRLTLPQFAMVCT